MDIYTTTSQPAGYGYVDGTSFAAPQVAGIAAIILSVNPDLSPSDVRDILETTAIDMGDTVGWDEEYGYGRINAYYAVAPPAAPTNFTLTNEGGKPRLRWNTNNEPDLIGYNLYKELNTTESGIDTFVYFTTDTTYLDNNFQIGGRPPFDVATYWVTAVDITDQESDPSFPPRSTLGQSSIQWKLLAEKNIPEVYRLSPNFPNPFNPTTTINYGLPEDSFVELSIYNVLGKEIIKLTINNETAGFKSVLWNGMDNDGNPVSSGMYFYQLKAIPLEGVESFSQVKKMILLR